VYITLDAITTSTVTFFPANGISSFDSLQLEHTDQMMNTLLSRNGLDIQSSNRLAFLHILSGLQDFDEMGPIVAQNGYVAGISALWKCSTLQQDALAIRYETGQIKKDGVIYDSVREADFSTYRFSSAQDPLYLHGIYTGLIRLTENCLFKTKVSVTGSPLAIKYYIVRARESLFKLGDTTGQKDSHKNYGTQKLRGSTRYMSWPQA